MAQLSNYIFLVSMLILAGVAAVVEAAISRMSLARIEELAEEEPGKYKGAFWVVQQKSACVGAFQLIYLFSLIATSIFALRIFDGYLELDRTVGDIVTLLALTVFSYVVFVVGARTIGRQHSERIVVKLAGVIRITSVLLGPLVRILILISNAITPGKGFVDGPFSSTSELRELVEQASTEVIEDEEKKMLQSVFELGDTVAREVMVPRTEMVWIEKHKTLRQAMSLGLRSGYSRIPVIGEDIDDIVGVVYLKDIARRTFEHTESGQSENVESIMRKAFFSPDSKSADELLRDMQKARIHIAILIDEYGGTAGLLTIEDILEEIVGEIADEYDTEASEIVELEDGVYRVSTRLHIEDLAELLEIELDAEDEGIDTVAGLLALRLGRVPIPGSAIDVDGWNLCAESVAGRRNKVGSVLVRKIQVDQVNGS
ncbi:MAG: hemolysin family protein [Candidatus Nanopelagicales bacterium]